MDSTDRSAACTPASITQSPRHESRTFAGSPSTWRSSGAAGAVARRPRPPAQSRDTSDMRARLTSTHFVGRVGELAELELALREAAASRPVLVLLGGESGVGKTRLDPSSNIESPSRAKLSWSCAAKPSSRATGSFPTHRCSERCDRWYGRATRRSRRFRTAPRPSSPRCCRGSMIVRRDPSVTIPRPSCGCSRRCSSCLTC